MVFFRSKIFLLTVLIQAAGPFLFSLGDWANVIQYLSGFGMAYAFWEYTANHKPEVETLKKQIAHLHRKHDALREMIADKEKHSNSM